MKRAKCSKRKQLNELRDAILELGLPEAALQPEVALLQHTVTLIQSGAGHHPKSLFGLQLTGWMLGKVETFVGHPGQ